MKKKKDRLICQQNMVLTDTICKYVFGFFWKKRKRSENSSGLIINDATKTIMRQDIYFWGGGEKKSAFLHCIRAEDAKDKVQKVRACRKARGIRIWE